MVKFLLKNRCQTSITTGSMGWTWLIQVSVKNKKSRRCEVNKSFNIKVLFTTDLEFTNAILTEIDSYACCDTSTTQRTKICWIHTSSMETRQKYLRGSRIESRHNRPNSMTSWYPAAPRGTATRNQPMPEDRLARMRHGRRCQVKLPYSRNAASLSASASKLPPRSNISRLA